MTGDDVVTVLRRAIADPGHVLPRVDGEGRPQWSARAVLARGFRRLDVDELGARLDGVAALLPGHELVAPNGGQAPECVGPEACARCALDLVRDMLDDKSGRLSSKAQGGDLVWLMTADRADNKAAAAFHGAARPTVQSDPSRAEATR